MFKSKNLNLDAFKKEKKSLVTIKGCWGYQGISLTTGKQGR